MAAGCRLQEMAFCQASCPATPCHHVQPAVPAVQVLVQGMDTTVTVRLGVPSIT
jgi:hypothetical protein